MSKKGKPPGISENAVSNCDFSDEWFELNVHESAIEDVREMLASIPSEPNMAVDAMPIEVPLSYAQHRFSNAVRILATTADMKRGLVAAYLEIHCIPKGVLPEQIRGDFAWICEKMTSKERSISVTQFGMHNSTREKIAERICLIESLINFDTI